MLDTRILTTIEFFALQHLPLTALELHTFLLNHPHAIRSVLDAHGEVIKNLSETDLEYVTLGEVMEVARELIKQGKLETHLGYYCLQGQRDLITNRLHSYSYGIVREKRIKRFLPFLRHLPFIRGIGLTGSQVIGPQKPTSDIDLLVITDRKFLWLARSFITAFFQIFGVRRHGKKIANRFCLNHYLAEPKRIGRAGNIYTALEYMKLRPLVGKTTMREFVRRNRKWLQNFFPHAALMLYGTVENDAKSSLKRFLEYLCTNRFGVWLEATLKQTLRARIRTKDDVVVEEDELLFHHDGKQHDLTRKFLALPIFQTPIIEIAEIEIVDIEVRI